MQRTDSYRDSGACASMVQIIVWRSGGPLATARQRERWPESETYGRPNVRAKYSSDAASSATSSRTDLASVAN